MQPPYQYYKLAHTYIHIIRVSKNNHCFSLRKIYNISRMSTDIKNYYLHPTCPIFCTAASISQTTRFSSPPSCLHQLPKLMSAHFQRRRHFHFHFHGKATFTQNRGLAPSLGPIDFLHLHNSCLIVLLVQLLLLLFAVVRI